MVRQLRDMADANAVTVRVRGDIPAVEVNAAAVELCLTNLISNAIKYADPASASRWVEVRARLATDAVSPGQEVVVEIVDNGAGVPAGERAQLFERYFRAEDARGGDIDGTGLGLSIVRETAAELGGRAWAEFLDGESIFGFTLPRRRSDDAG